MQRVSAVVNLVDELAQREGFSGLTPLMVKVLRDLRWQPGGQVLGSIAAQVLGLDLEGLADAAFCFFGRTYGRAPPNCLDEFDLIYELPLTFKNTAFYRETVVIRSIEEKRVAPPRCPQSWSTRPDPRFRFFAPTHQARRLPRRQR